MTKLNYKNILILILMTGASVVIIKDFIQLMQGATYTWFGAFTSLINIAVVGKGLDYFRG